MQAWSMPGASYCANNGSFFSNWIVKYQFAASYLPGKRSVAFLSEGGWGFFKVFFLSQLLTILGIQRLSMFQGRRLLLLLQSIQYVMHFTCIVHLSQETANIDILAWWRWTVGNIMSSKGKKLCLSLVDMFGHIKSVQFPNKACHLKIRICRFISFWNDHKTHAAAF